ncbi:MAG: porphobilinogen synthase [Tepidanaerobacter acetatoxydans]|jgi:porphobilinogen synthase|uniref:Delta-aminolevulinic acid dehydratase n=1 Tax=Tepidanaerobacter acetatoxydans (strain DSM 21804 / JCM 16047 / Re1) TaxID=1209989 RepID=F4LUU4_TEPAE|nr:porphobilinogen synthase [Tepidanaerobacter acetatoxydans]AEE90662.1 Porphobilinogen synthase [Tepidanaerobacter acetatoxydans Re1]NLU11519.1 porphobilinogen synthase [Tepidanaerobacter acetatoxydans]CCP25192.1 delta-aminolevulinic acid dehydratase (porphobilinogen synthase) [Tepidanaerobacter acetatoxydans Re1]
MKAELVKRPRRLRLNQNIRDMVRETSLNVKDLIYPYFVVEGENVKEEIEAMPKVFHFSIDKLVKDVKETYELGIPAILLFGIPSSKDEVGSQAYASSGIVQRAVRAIKEAIPSMIVITDVCLCEYTSHGHCGVVESGYVDNDKTLELIAKTALSHAKAGADMVAPSDMMDGRVGCIRQILDSEGYVTVPIMAYSAKYASGFYGPFREAAQSAPQFGDRRSYQMDPANSDEALREIALDIEEGADIVMVKPALAYLDIIRRAKDSFKVPLATYNVSGEYSMIKAAALKGWLDEKVVVLESLTSMKRAGADMIITYFAKDAAKWLTTR